MAKQNLQIAVENNISPVSISVSSLDEKLNGISSGLINNSILVNYTKELNRLSDIRDYLMMFINNLTITNMNSIILQSTVMVELTATTNQLTRYALSLVSIECYQLSIALFNIVQSSTYEDVQLASSLISQCSSNILTSVNIPLQERGVVLDIDINRENDPMIDYDIEFLNEKTINFDVQQELSQIIINQCEEIKLIISNTLNIFLNIEQSLFINTSSVIMFLQRVSINTLPNKTIQLNNNAQIRLPSIINFNTTTNSAVVLRCILTPLAMANHRTGATTNLSSLLSIDFLDEGGDEISVYTSNDNVFELNIPSDINWIVPSLTLQNVSSITNNSPFNLHFVNITQSNINISISVHFEMHPLNINLGYMLIYKFDSVPQLNSSINQIDGWSLMCPLNLTNDDLFIYFIDNQRTFRHQSIVFGLRELNSIELNTYCKTAPMSPPITDHPSNFSSDYELRIFSSGCYYLDSNFNWQSDGLTVGPNTNPTRTQCFSTHLSTFSGGFFVLPTPINWKYVFANIDFTKNRTVYLTVIIILLIYIIFLIYSRHQDHKDAEKLGISVLAHNQSADKYFYQVLVFTGIRKNSQTNAKVEFILSGVDAETDVFYLFNPCRKILQRESIDSFLLGVPRSLGKLTHLHIWLNNSANDSQESWFLKYFIVRDLQTMEKYHFLSQQWLTAEKRDTSVECIFPLASNNEKYQFGLNIPYNMYHNIFDEHLWFSIFSRLPTRSFTRVQRCTCCFVLLFTGMLLDILYYDQTLEAENTKELNGLLIGPFYISREQIGIGIITDILMFIPSLLLVMFFRRIRRRHSLFQISPILQVLSHTPPKIIDQSKKKRDKLLPWWCLFIAYSLSCVMIIISMLLIIARGIEFGDVKVQKWLGSLLIGFFSSILLTQPIKVLGLTLFAVFINRQNKSNKKFVNYIDKNESFYFNDDEENMKSIHNSLSHNQSNTEVIELKNSPLNRLNQHQLPNIVID